MTNHARPSSSAGISVVIRAAKAGDATAISALLADAFVEYRELYTTAGYDATVIDPERVLERLDQGPIWVAIINQRIVGTVSAIRQEDSVYLRGMAIHPCFRGQGVGGLLLNQVEHFAESSGTRRLFLSTTPFLDRAISLYQKFGFHRTDEVPGDLFGTPLFTMEKSR